jgi:hypothetical protein
MSDNGPKSITLRHLRALDQRMERLEAAIDRLTLVVVGRESRLAALEDARRDETQSEGGSPRTRH